jgi:hypothetical protein
MKTRITIFFVFLALCLLVSACGLSKPATVIAPTPTPIPGWEKFTASGIEIWLPESFEGGDLENDLDVIVEKLKSLGSDFEGIAQAIEANPSTFALWVFNTKVGESGYLTNMNITTEKVLSTITLDTYVDAFKKQIPSSMSITDQQKVQLNQFEAVRLVVETDVYNITAKELVYIVKDQNTIWAITYATSGDEFNSLLPVFEQSALTFKTTSPD